MGDDEAVAGQELGVHVNTCAKTKNAKVFSITERLTELVPFLLRRVENTVDGKANVQILGRAAHLKPDQLAANEPCLEDDVE